jgi:hypothetical protein
VLAFNGMIGRAAIDIFTIHANTHARILSLRWDGLRTLASNPEWASLYCES